MFDYLIRTATIAGGRGRALFNGNMAISAGVPAGVVGEQRMIEFMQAVAGVKTRMRDRDTGVCPGRNHRPERARRGCAVGYGRALSGGRCSVVGPDGRALRFPSAHAASRYVARQGDRGRLERVHQSAYAEMSAAGAADTTSRFRLGLALDD